MAFFPPPLAEAAQHNFTKLTAPVNLAGLPALALPVPSRRRLPASLQLIGPAHSEELLLATGEVLGPPPATTAKAEIAAGPASPTKPSPR